MKMLMLSSVTAVLLSCLIAATPVFAQGPLPAKASMMMKVNRTIAPSIVATIRDHAMEFDPPGNVLRHVDKSDALFITSGRNQILFQYRQAKAQGAEFIPMDYMLKDVVRVTCGDADLGEKFECSSVQVISPSGVVIEPLTYAAEANTYSNGYGHTWTVNEVSAEYPTVPLQDGFTVRFSNASGMHWTQVVTADQAWYGLLLGMPSK